MDRHYLELLIKETITEILAREAYSLPKPETKTALICFSGALIGFEESIAQLKEIKAAGWKLDWCQTDAASRVLDQTLIASLEIPHREKSLIANHELLIIPTLTGNLAAKVAHGICDDFASNVIAEFIQSGQKIIAVKSAACPDRKEKRQLFPEMPKAWKKLMRNNLSLLASYGVSLVEVEQLAATVLSKESPNLNKVETGINYSQKLLSLAQIRQYPSASTLLLAPKTLVTDLAREYASKTGITLIKR